MRAVLLQNDAEARCPTVGRAERKNSRVVRNISDGAFCGFQLDRSPYIYSTINNTGFLPLNIGYGDPKYPRGHNEFDNQLKVERQMRAAYQNHLYEDHEKRRLIVELLELQGRPTAQQRTPTLSDTLLRSPKRLARLSPSVYHPIKPYNADTRGHLEATAPLISMMQVSGGPRSSTAHPSISAPLQQSFHSKDLLQSSMRAVDHVNTPVGDLSLVMESLANPRPNSALTMASHGSSAQLSAMRSNAPSLRSGTPDIRSRGNSRLHSARDRLTHNNSAEDYSSAVLHGVDVMPPLQCTTKKRVHIFRDFANNGRVAAMSALTSESFLVEAAENGDAPLPSRVTSPAAPVARNSSTPSFREDEYMCDERLARLVRVSHAKKVGAM